MFGIQTRKASVGMLSLVMIEAVQCIHLSPDWFAERGFVMLVVACLTVLIAQGGGRYSRFMTDENSLTV